MSTSDDMGEGIEGDSVLVAEFVLGILGAAEHAEMARRIRAEPALAAEQAFWENRLSDLDVEFEEARVPGNILPLIEARAFGQSAGKPGFASWWDSLNVWRGLATGALAVAIVAIGLNVAERETLDSAALATQLVAALQTEGSDVRFVALYDGTGNVRLSSLSGEAVPDRDFELWAIQGGNNPVSMGVIPIGQRSAVELAANLRSGFGAGSVLAITLEPKGGSPSGDPTGPIVASGPAIPI